MNLGIRNKILAGYTVLMGLMAVLVIITVLNLNTLLSNFNFLIDHDQPVLTGTAELTRLVVDMETGMRGYLITGDENFLAPLYQALYDTTEVEAGRALELGADGHFMEEFDILYDFVSDNPAQQEQLDLVLENTRAWIDNVAQHSITLRLGVNDATGTFDVLSDQLSEGSGKVIIDELRGLVDEIIASAEATDADGVQNDDGVIETLEFLLIVVNMETGQRGFLMTGEDTFLEPFDAGRTARNSQLASLRREFRNDAINLARINQVDELANRWLTEVADPEILARRNIDADQATFGDLITFIASGIGKEHVDAIRSELTIFEDQEILLNDQRNQETRDLANNTRNIILAVAGVSIAIGFAASLYIGNAIAKNIRLVMIAAQNVIAGDMDQELDIRSSDEVGILASAFNEMVATLRSTMESQVAKDYIENVINEYLDFVGRVADGDLTVQLDLSRNGNSREDDLYLLGNNLNDMVYNLRDMATQIRETAVNVASASTEILAATTQQIASISEQEAAVTQTMATVEEVRTTVKQTSDRAENVAEASRKSVDISVEGQQSVTNSIEGMQVIQQKVEGIAENILMLSERTQQIGEIIDTVNEIAAQSKLLALNASIEAARAGEEGKGFAVVAMEVRQLAEQSRDATDRVRDILNQIQQATNTAVMVTEEGSKGAEAGMLLVQSAGQSIDDLSNTIEDASQAATQIAASTSQQNNGMEQLAQAMLSIQQASIQTAASSQQAERSARELNELARQMQDAISRYQLG